MKKGRILVVDDLPDVRSTISGLLLDMGFDVFSAATKNDALRLMRTNRFDVTILDVRLDETDEDNRDGLLLMHEISENYPETTVVILTGHADVRIVREALQPDKEGNSPAFGFLEKNELDQFNDYITRAMIHSTVGNSSGVQHLISQGENELVEFKSSICWDYKAHSADRSIKSAIARTIVGFLNSRGGTLLIGVADDGTVTGIERDIDTLAKKNQDGFQLELTNIISFHLGVEHLAHIHPRFERIKGRVICSISIDKSPAPVFLKGDDSKLWVRAGNSTRYLGVRAAINHLQANWPSKQKKEI